MKVAIPKNKAELLKRLEGIAKSRCFSTEASVFALALAYLINEYCPDDRTTKHVFRKRSEKNECRTT